MTTSSADPGEDGVETDAEGATSGVGESEVAAVAVRSVVSQKELARDFRRQAYQRAKAQRAADPRYAQLKEAVKLRRRELYQKVKEQRKADATRAKATRTASQAEERAQARAVVRRELQQGFKARAEERAVLPSQSPSSELPRREPQHEGGGEPEARVPATPQQARVRELMQKVRLASEPPTGREKAVTSAEAQRSACQVIPLFPRSPKSRS